MIIDHIELFTPRRDIHGLGLRKGNNLNMHSFRLFKTQDDFPFQALKL